MKREEFLKEFLGALGAVEVIIKEVLNDRICGTVIYDIEDPEEYQDFCWFRSQNNEIPFSLYNLACLLNEQRLLANDKVTVSKEELLNRYNKKWNNQLTQYEFDILFDDLKQVNVNMIDDGKETDNYFIHY